MKRILLSMLALGAMTGCANQELLDTPQPQDLVPIDLNAGVQAVTRAGAGPVESGEFTFGIAGWETDQATPTYASKPSWKNTATGDASTTKAIAWDGSQPYYNADNAQKTHILAWYPAGTLDDAGKVAFTDKDGLVDVLVANKVTGSKDAAAGALTFAHKTTQFVFKVVKGEGLTDGTTLTSIKINGAAVPNGIDFTGAEPAVTYEAAAQFTVPGISNAAIGAEAQVGNAVMLKPFDAETFTIDVVTSTGTFTGVTVKNNTASENFIAGTAYTITLTFNQKAVDIQSSVSAWKPGQGSGTVE